MYRREQNTHAHTRMHAPRTHTYTRMQINHTIKKKSYTQYFTYYSMYGSNLDLI
jgi:hypothetical protein